MATHESELNRYGTATAPTFGILRGSTKNVGQTERWVSAIGGGALALYGLKHGGLGGAALALAGGGLIFRGATGHCEMYKALGVNRADHARRASLGPGEGIRIERSVTIDRPRSDVYAFWRNLENLPRFMEHVESVMSTGGRLSHWIVKGPGGSTVEWDADIVNDEKDELIAWRSLEGATVASAGSVHFADAPNGRGTEVHVTLRYSPPGGRLGAIVAYLLGEEPGLQIEEDLERLKRVLETGGATAEGKLSRSV